MHGRPPSKGGKCQAMKNFMHIEEKFVIFLEEKEQHSCLSLSSREAGRLI